MPTLVLSAKYFIGTFYWPVSSHISSIHFCAWQPKIANKSINSYFGVQGHLRSLILIFIERRMAISCIIYEIWGLIGLKSPIFRTFFSCSALDRDDRFRVSEKVLRILKLESLRQSAV